MRKIIVSFFVILLILLFAGVFKFFRTLNINTKTLLRVKSLLANEIKQKKRIAEYEKKLKEEYESYILECGKKYKDKETYLKHLKEYDACLLVKLEKKETDPLNNCGFHRWTEGVLNRCYMPYVKLFYCERKLLSIASNMNQQECNDGIYDLQEYRILSYLSLGMFDKANSLVEKMLISLNNEEESGIVKIRKKFLISIKNRLADNSIQDLDFITKGLKDTFKILKKPDSLTQQYFENNQSVFLTCDKYGLSPLHYLLSFKKQSFVLSVLKNYKVNFLEDSFPILLFAILTHSNDVADYLLKNRPECIREDYLGLNWLDYAVIFNNREIILRKKNKVKTFVNVKDKFGNTPVFYAVQFVRNDFLKFLLDSGANTDIKNNLKFNALDYAVMGGNLDAIKLLTQYGMNLNLSQLKSLFDFFYCKDNICELLRFFSEKKLFLPGDLLFYSLNCAVENNKIETVKCLLDYNFDLSYRFSDGKTIFFKIKSPKIAEILLKKLKNPEVLLIEGGRNFLAVDAVDGKVKRLYENYLFTHNLYPKLKEIRNKYAK